MIGESCRGWRRSAHVGTHTQVGVEGANQVCALYVPIPRHVPQACCVSFERTSHASHTGLPPAITCRTGQPLHVALAHHSVCMTIKAHRRHASCLTTSSLVALPRRALITCLATSSLVALPRRALMTRRALLFIRQPLHPFPAFQSHPCFQPSNLIHDPLPVYSCPPSHHDREKGAGIR